MSLPRELRDEVYKYILIKGSVFPLSHIESHEEDGLSQWWNPKEDKTLYLRNESYPKDWDMEMGSDWRPYHSRPIGLVAGVSKTIQQEAAAIYYGRNRFFLPFFGTNILLRNAAINSNYISSIRDVSYAFHWLAGFEYHSFLESISTAHRHAGWGWKLGKRGEKVKDFVPERLLEDLEGQVWDGIADLTMWEWNSTVSAVCNMPLDRLTLGIEECATQIGSEWRLVEDMMPLLVRTLKIKPHLPKVIELITDEENFKGRTRGCIHSRGKFQRKDGNKTINIFQQLTSMDNMGSECMSTALGPWGG